MPTYVYRCEQCGHKFEAQQHMTDDPLTICPNCQGHVHRILFPAAVVFKGSGFYSTDHRPSAAATEPAPGDAASPGGTSAAAETPKAPATPPPAAPASGGDA
jgi:putative FmdB family regulatory protein